MRSLLSEAIKTCLATLLYYSGACWLHAQWRLRNRAIVLMYHRVLPASQMEASFSADSIVVSPATFERQMQLLHRWLNPIATEKLRSMLAGESDWLPRSCVVTFDDGWFDNVENALPILARTRTPATIFLATGYVGSQECFWQERLTALLCEEWHEHGPSSSILQDLEAGRAVQDGSSSVRAHMRRVVTSIKDWPRESIHRLIEELSKKHDNCASHTAVDRFMSWDDARLLANSEWVTLGSHAHSHTPLTMLTASALRDDLAHADALFRAEIGQGSRAFAYPNGNHDAFTVAAIRNAGHELAFTTESGLIGPGDDPLRLKRVNISETGTDSDAKFLCRLFGWF